MNANPQPIARARRPRSRRALTLIELLVVIAIIAMLVAILLPYLRASREEAKIVRCQANLRELITATQSYWDDQEDRRLLPWYQIPPHKDYSPTVVTPWVFGGFRAPKPNPYDQYVDSSMYPAQVRPLNKYIDRTAQAAPFNFKERGRDMIKSFVCPGDRSNTTAIIGEPGKWIEEEHRSSWEANGSSYTLNTRWLQGYAGFDFSPAIHDPVVYDLMCKQIARYMSGGNASRFILWMEQGFYSAAYNAAPEDNYPGLPPALPQRDGWHRKFSSWTMGFADGHVSHGFFDSRYVSGLGGTLWQPDFNGDTSFLSSKSQRY
jgi:prepilin-type N-terminal cleavage/methylation domain-containing protein